MTDISSIKVVGIDEERPPIVRKEGYIDLYFKLSEKAPVEWCEDFNKLGHRLKPPVKIRPDKGLIMETYVHDMNAIQQQLDKIKEKIKQCSTEYLEREKQRMLALAARQAERIGSSDKQTLLNEIVAGLDYRAE
jgi:hypothetical protein